MDLIAWLMVAVFCLVGAAIAYFADALGRTLGKKRASLWGLRPRHTAAVLTTGAGFLIPLVTVGLLWLVSADVRTILREGARAAAERDRKVAELIEVQEQVRSSEREVQDLERQRNRAQRSLDATRANLAQSSAEAERLGEEAAKLRLEARRLVQEAVKLRRQVDVARRQFSLVQRDLRASRSENANLVDANQVLRAENLGLRREYEAYSADSISLRQELLHLERQVTHAQGEVQSAQADLAEVNQRYIEARDAFATDIETARADLERARLETDRAKGELDRLRLISSDLLQGLDNARTRQMIVMLGEELARTPIGAGLSDEEARRAVTSALRSGRAAALERGANPEPGQTAGLRPLTRAGSTVSPEEQEAEAVRALVGRNEQSVVLVYALWNAFAGEFIPLRLEVLPNPLVYAPGAIVAETRIDGEMDQNAIVEAIARFLQVTVAERALANRMIPAEGRPERFGTIDPDATIRLMNEIQGSRRVVRVQALASGATRAADPLRLEFRVR